MDEIRNYLIEKLNQNKLMCKKHKKKLQRSELYLPRIVISTISGCVSISAFASLVSITIGITISGTELKICTISAGIKKYKSMIKKKKKQHDKQFCQQNFN